MNIEPYYQVTLFTEDEKEFLPPIRFSDEQQALEHYNQIVETINTGEEQRITGVSLFYVNHPGIPALISVHVKGSSQ